MWQQIGPSRVFIQTRLQRESVSRVLLLVLLVSLAASPRGLVAQEVRQIQTTLSCTACELHTETLAEIGGDGPAFAPVSSVQTVARDAMGRYWMSFGSAALVHVFDADGAFVGEVGRRGQGPGEFTAPMALASLKDSMAVFDRTRMTVVGPDLAPTRDFRIDGQVFSAVTVAWPLIAINARLGIPGASGRPFHILNVATGEVEHSFGMVQSDPDPWAAFAHLALGPGGREIWTAARTRLEVQRWSLEGVLLETFQGEPAWFPTGGRGQMGNHQTPPDPLVVDMLVREEGVLLFLALPRADWRRAWGTSQTTGHIPAADLPEAHSLRQARVALLDPRDGSIVSIWDDDRYGQGLGSLSDGFVALRGASSFDPILEINRYWVSHRQ